jgi:hypothetical protein
MGFTEIDVPFETGRALLQSIMWFCYLPLSGADLSQTLGRDELVRATPLLRGLSLLYDIVSAPPHAGDSLASSWDSEGARTRNACLYRLLQDVNWLFDVVASLVCPMYGDAPFFPASIRQRDGLNRTETLLSPYYALRDSPADPRNALERPNILAAFAHGKTSYTFITGT